MNTEIKPVITANDLKVFIQLFYNLYRNSPYATPYLYMDEVKTLSKDKNPAFDFCEAAYFLAYQQGKPVGRIAAIINRRANEYWKRNTVRFGWFDFIDDPDVSQSLLKAVEEWGKNKGMTEMAGPLGFEDMDREGMLVSGFETLSTMYVNYNYPYYPQHIEAMGGCKKDNDYVEYEIKIPEKAPERMLTTAEMIGKRYHLEVRKFSREELTKGGRGHELFNILNITYKDLYGFSQLSSSQIDKLVNDYIRLADLNLVTCIVDTSQNNKMVGFGVSFPSFSKALKKTRDGRLLPFGWWPLLKVLKWHNTDVVDLLLIGVLPEYRPKGANILIITDLISWYRRYHFKVAVTGPQMETNKKVLSQWQYFDAGEIRRHRIYCKDI